MNEEIIVIKGEQIPIIIKSYSTSKSVKMFFKNDKVTITKPTRLSKKNLSEIIKKNEDSIYTIYKNGMQNKKEEKKWKTGESIFYKGEKFDIIREEKQSNQIHIYIKEEEKQIKAVLPYNIDETQVKDIMDKGIGSLFRNNTGVIIQERLPYWSKITGINYSSFTIRDAKTRYGSCVSKTKRLRFSSRLIMLPEKAIDAVIVHELCHIVHANHSQNFYNLVKKYIPDYENIDKWLKKNGEIINY